MKMLNRLSVLGLFLLASAACGKHEPVFLSRPGVGSAEETLRYYKNIDAPPTFAAFLADRCFNPGEVLAAYYNDSDLGLGREMRCAICPPNAPKNANLISCSVSNHGVPQGLDGQANGRSREESIKKALGDLESFLETKKPPRGATVAMDYLPGRSGEVRFYIYDGENPDPAKLTVGNTVPGGLIPGLQLDTEGVKFIRNCLTCHGGRYSAESDIIFGSSFLDFLEQLFVFGDDAFVKATRPKAGDADFVAKLTSRVANEETIRQLNAIVLKTKPAPLIQDRIQKSYPCGVDNPGCRYVGGYVPDGWQTNAAFFKEAVLPYCATCHFSQQPNFNLQSDKEVNGRPWLFDTAQQFLDPKNQELIVQTTCQSSDMPHAEVTRNALKRDSSAFSKLCVDSR